MTFLFFRPGESGARVEVFAITLEEAMVSEVRHEKVNAPQSTTFEYVSFTYDKITWEEVPNGISAFDSWQQPRRSQ